MRDREDQVSREMQRCRHFNGIQHKCCEAGVNYMSVRDTSGKGLAKFPCLTLKDGHATTTCSKRDLPSRQDAEAIVDQREASIAAFLKKSCLGICGTCDSESTDWRQHGDCIYSVPCGHRVGQGDAKGYKAGVLKARAEAKR
jgi:hypothetical protein